MRRSWIIGLSLFAHIGFAQTDSIMVKTIKIGESKIEIIQQYGQIEDDVLFINVHEDEQTSIDAVDHYSQQSPLHFVRLKHVQSRRIDFSLRGKNYSVDPNRIFTRKGRRKTLKDGGKFSFKAAKQVKLLAADILSYLEGKSIVVAMHNNTDVNYSIKSYLPDGDEAKNTADIHISDAWDADDFIYTTDKKFFDIFKAKDLNVILQDNKGYVNDGSLSVYCGSSGIPYINIEAQKGHFDEQVKLLEEVIQAIDMYKK